jgi:hypothetical protein
MHHEAALAIVGLPYAERRALMRTYKKRRPAKHVRYPN